jgi:2',3'-cyclic-nucleotide 2'-phosphodiesterase/3'-nucleotidase
MKFEINYIVFSFLLYSFITQINGQTIYIAYTLVSAIDSMRKMYPDLILLDSGDFLKTYPLADANRLMIDLMHRMDYDAIGVGEQEYVDGETFLLSNLLKFPLPLISSNIIDHKDKTWVFTASKILKRKKKTIGILGVVFENSFDYIPKPDVDIMSVEDQIAKTIAAQSDKVDLFVLLFHGSYREGLVIAQKFQDIDVIICGHTQERYEQVFDNHIVVQPGVDGEFLGLIEVQFDSKNLIFKNNFYPVNSHYGQNQIFKEKVDDFFIRYKQKDN